MILFIVTICQKSSLMSSIRDTLITMNYVKVYVRKRIGKTIPSQALVWPSVMIQSMGKKTAVSR